MSNISNTHDLVTFDSKNSKAFTGQRLARISYKTPKDGKKLFESVCVSVPPLAIDLTTVPDAITPHMASWLQDVQDKIIRARYEDGARTISDSDITIECCIAFLEQDAKGNRLTKEFLLEWFASKMADNLMLAISDKLKLSDTPSEAETKRVEQMLNAYRDSVAALSGGKTAYTVEKAMKLQKAVELADDDETKVKLIAKLQEMQKPV